MSRDRRPARNSNGGFLLAETLATFTISAFVMLAMVSAASVLVHAVDRSTAQVQSTDDLGQTLFAISRDVAMLKRARWAGDEPQSFVFRGGPNSLFFVREGRAADGLGERQVVALREIVGRDGPVLTRSDAPLSGQAHGFAYLRFGVPRPLATGPARLRFSYVAKTPEGERRTVDWPSGPRLPSAVVVEAVEADTGRLLESDRIAIQADADLGCVPNPQDQQGVTAAFLNIGISSAPPPPPPAVGGQSTDANGPFCGRADKGVQ